MAVRPGRSIAVRQHRSAVGSRCGRRRNRRRAAAAATSPFGRPSTGPRAGTCSVPLSLCCWSRSLPFLRSSAGSDARSRAVRRVRISDVLALAAIGIWLFAAEGVQPRQLPSLGSIRWCQPHAGARRYRGGRAHNEESCRCCLRVTQAPDSRTVLGCSPCCRGCSTTTPQNIRDCSVRHSITDDGHLCARVPHDAADGIVRPGPRSRCRWTSRSARDRSWFHRNGCGPQHAGRRT